MEVSVTTSPPTGSPWSWDDGFSAFIAWNLIVGVAVHVYLGLKGVSYLLRQLGTYHRPSPEPASPTLSDMPRERTLPQWAREMAAITPGWYLRMATTEPDWNPNLSRLVRRRRQEDRAETHRGPTRD